MIQPFVINDTTDMTNEIFTTSTLLSIAISRLLIMKSKNVHFRSPRYAFPSAIISVPMQTAILGHLSADAIAANSVSSTFFQYLKVIVIAISSASAVVIGKDIGEGDIERVKSDGRTLSVMDLLIGVVLASLLFVLRGPLLSMYKLTDTAAVLADHFIMIMSIVMVGMSYQMPVSVGVIQGGGDTKFSMYTNLISTWGIVMPLSFLAAFVWKLPVELVVAAVQSDQLFKGIPVFLRFRSYKWIHKLT